MLQVTPLGMEFATLLILRLKRVTERKGKDSADPNPKVSV